VVAGVGARTAVGATAPATAAAVRAAIAAFSRHPFLFDTAGEPYQVARATYLEIDLVGAARLAELAGPAATEALAPLAAAAVGKLTIPAFIGLPPDRPGRPKDAAAAVIERVREELTRAKLQPGRVQVIETGHAAGAMAVQTAWEVVRSGAAEFALAGGVDSYLEPETMAWLEASDQAHGAIDNSWGFVPGEGAGFALLAAAPTAGRYKLPADLELVTAATARETKLIKTDAVCLGEGLTDLFRALAARLAPGVKADHLVCDMNGEPYRADEFGFAVLRAGELFRDASAFATPASSWGDVGAAAGPLFLVLCAAEAKKGYARGPMTAAFTSSEAGERCGFVVRSRLEDRVK
jgi:3-oxoacyl-[acyl-carrier-protein] synthase-1